MSKVLILLFPGWLSFQGNFWKTCDRQQRSDRHKRSHSFSGILCILILTPSLLLSVFGFPSTIPGLIVFWLSVGHRRTSWLIKSTVWAFFNICTLVRLFRLNTVYSLCVHYTPLVFSQSYKKNSALKIANHESYDIRPNPFLHIYIFLVSKYYLHNKCILSYYHYELHISSEELYYELIFSQEYQGL